MSIFINDITKIKIYKNKDLKKINNSIINLVKFRLKNFITTNFFFINKKGVNIFDYLSTKNMIDENFENLNKKIMNLQRNTQNLYYLIFNSIIENSQQKHI